MKLERRQGKGPWRAVTVNRVSRPLQHRQMLGRAGEERAAAYLTQQGYEILFRNWNTRRGELDLVIRRGLVLVVVEVRAWLGERSGPWRSGGPEQTVRGRKQRVLIKAARAWLSGPGRVYCVPGWSLRFDVVGVRMPRGKVCHLEGAFTAQGL